MKFLIASLFALLIGLAGTTASASEYTDNPTIPGNGTPQRSQGSGTR